jgi:hypothetical protein
MIYMKNLNDLLKAEKRHQLMLGVVFVIYILMNVKTPRTFAGLVDNLYGNIVVIVIAMSVFTQSNPVVGILAMVAAYELIKRSNVGTGNHAIRNYLPSDKSKVMDFSRYNDFPVTLEEQVVKRMAPLVKHDAPPNSNYKPVLNALHDASPINYEGVI